MLTRLSAHRWKNLAILLCAVLLAFRVGTSAARDDHDRARKALEGGEVLPLSVILEKVKKQYPGEVIDVELERGHGGEVDGWVYEVKVLQSGGDLIKLKLDARAGTILGRKSRERHQDEGSHQ
jgi:uncharacterized membrane protein YkoI